MALLDLEMIDSSLTYFNCFKDTFEFDSTISFLAGWFKYFSIALEVFCLLCLISALPATASLLKSAGAPDLLVG